MNELPLRRFLEVTGSEGKQALTDGAQLLYLTGYSMSTRNDVEEADKRRARAIIEHYQDKEFSYGDAVSFAIMERLDIREALAFDDHFRQYGQFTIL